MRAEARRLVGNQAPLGDDDAAALATIGIDLSAVVDQVERSFGAGALASDAPGRGRFPRRPFTKRAKKVLGLALREALRLHHDYIGTEHLLLGLIREGDGLAAKILVDGGISLEALRDRVLAGIEDVEPAVRRSVFTGSADPPATRSSARAKRPNWPERTTSAPNTSWPLSSRPAVARPMPRCTTPGSPSMESVRTSPRVRSMAASSAGPERGRRFDDAACA